MGPRRRLAVAILLASLLFLRPVSAQLPGVIASTPYLQSITVSGLSTAACTNGFTYPATATGHSSQSATRNDTTSVAWSCNANCSVDSGGHVTITGPPSSTARATATLQGKSGSDSCIVNHL